MTAILTEKGPRNVKHFLQKPAGRSVTIYGFEENGVVTTCMYVCMCESDMYVQTCDM